MENKEIKIKRVFIDMDGVLADFNTGVETLTGNPFPNTDQGHNDYDLRKEELTNKRLFRNLPPMPDMHELVGYVRHTNLPWEILTAAGVINRELVVYDKNEWIKQHVSPTVVVTCTMTGSQKGMFAIKGSVLIDDRQKNLDAWVENGGIGILHTSAEDTINQLKALRNGD
jgi:5'(3')-deoxyribonucleotidase|tara:strand:+ start:76 stop:585 length:510 start_codon:yes stop_codon:yes gene_type:complete